VIVSIHTLIYSDEPEATRAFLRDVLGWPYVEHAESEPGWFIFRSGPSEMGVHPTSGTYEGEEYSYPQHHSISLMCDDIEGTVSELEAKGAEFSGPVQDLGFGLGTSLKLPGAGEILVYEPRHPVAHNL
jgi:catechol 2,3-dioxygenase-like lactoylglutathione lyase family enzyme